VEARQGQQHAERDGGEDRGELEVDHETTMPWPAGKRRNSYFGSKMRSFPTQMAS
jgi:hypothetical protein